MKFSDAPFGKRATENISIYLYQRHILKCFFLFVLSVFCFQTAFLKFLGGFVINGYMQIIEDFCVKTLKNWLISFTIYFIVANSFIFSQPLIGSDIGFVFPVFWARA